MKDIKGSITLFLILEFFWVIWNNTWDLKIWFYGLFIVIPVVLLFRGGLYIFKGVKLSFAGFVYSFIYVGVFLIALAKSNLDVIGRVLNPKLPIRPGIVRVKTRLTSPLARLILANSITLTPGTFVVDIKEDTIYVHWISVCCEKDPEDITREIAGKFENLLMKIYE